MRVMIEASLSKRDKGKYLKRDCCCGIKTLSKHTHCQQCELFLLPFFCHCFLKSCSIFCEELPVSSFFSILSSCYLSCVACKTYNSVKIKKQTIAIQNITVQVCTEWR